MRRAATIILGLLLALGSTLSVPGHVHAAPDDRTPGGLHVDHVHFGSDHGSHHTEQGSAAELSGGHSGDDAITLSVAGREAVTKRQLPAFTHRVVSTGSSLAAPAPAHEIPEQQPPDPPPPSRPPGRAPPA